MSRREVRPGDKVRLNVMLAGENGAEIARQVEYQVPIGAAGRDRFTSPWPTPTPPTSPISARSSPRSRARAGQLIATVNNLHPNTKAYVRVWRAEPAFQLEGADLPDPPRLGGADSGGLAIQRWPASPRRAIPRSRRWRSDAGDMVISGVKTIQVEVKE